MPATDPIRPPRQARSRRTLSRIVSATETLLRERGPEAVTVQDVVARARTSVGSFYQRFSGKEELLRYVERTVLEDALARFDRGLTERITTDLSIEEQIRAVIALLVEEREAGASLPSADRLLRERADLVTRVLLERRPEIRHPEPEVAIPIGFVAVSGALRDRPSDMADEVLARELGRLWLSYLGGGQGARDAGGMDFFQVWS